MKTCPQCKYGMRPEWEKCPECGTRLGEDCRATPCSPLAVELKKAVSSVLQTVVRGHAEYRTEDGFLRWGRIESDIHGQIEAILEENGEADALATPEIDKP